VASSEKLKLAVVSYPSETLLVLKPRIVPEEGGSK
jgi:hypothetical protein